MVSTQEPLDSDLSPAARDLAQLLYLVHSSARGAYYNLDNCLKLVACAARLLSAALVSKETLAEGTLAADFGEALVEMRDFAATFSKRYIQISRM